MATEICSKYGIGNSNILEFKLSNIPPWQETTHLRWSKNRILDGGSKKSDPPETQLLDALETLTRLPGSNTLYSDGSAIKGTREGGSAVVVTKGDCRNPERIVALRKPGGQRTSSFETEVEALLMATQWCHNNVPRAEQVTICSDSQSALVALQHPKPMEWPRLTELRSELSLLTCLVIIQWVPGHCGLKGNEWADHEADRAAGRGEEDEWESAAINEPQEPQEAVSLSTARAALRETLLQPVVNHRRVAQVYGLGAEDIASLSQPPFNLRFDHWEVELSCLPVGNRVYPLIRQPDHFKRREAVLLAQLRAGHCHHLMAYCRIVNPLADPLCPDCKEEPEEIEHWLIRCPAWETVRRDVFGDRPPPLSALARAPTLVSQFARRTILRR